MHMWQSVNGLKIICNNVSTLEANKVRIQNANIEWFFRGISHRLPGTKICEMLTEEHPDNVKEFIDSVIRSMRDAICEATKSENNVISEGILKLNWMTMPHHGLVRILEGRACPNVLHVFLSAYIIIMTGDVGTADRHGSLSLFLSLLMALLSLSLTARKET